MQEIPSLFGVSASSHKVATIGCIDASSNISLKDKVNFIAYSQFIAWVLVCLLPRSFSYYVEYIDKKSGKAVYLHAATVAQIASVTLQSVRQDVAAVVEKCSSLQEGISAYLKEETSTSSRLDKTMRKVSTLAMDYFEKNQKEDVVEVTGLANYELSHLCIKTSPKEVAILEIANKILGKGSFSYVSCVRTLVPAGNISGNYVIKRSLTHEKEGEQDLLSETNKLSILNHTAIVSTPLLIRKYKRDKKELYFVIQRQFNMSLDKVTDALDKEERTRSKEEIRAASRFTPISLLEEFIRLTSAVAYLHKKGCVHGDIKPANIGDFGVFDSKRPNETGCKLFDFGGCDVSKTHSIGSHTPLFTPERTIRKNGSLNVKDQQSRDVFALIISLVSLTLGTQQALASRVDRQTPKEKMNRAFVDRGFPNGFGAWAYQMIYGIESGPPSLLKRVGSFVLPKIFPKDFLSASELEAKLKKFLQKIQTDKKSIR